MPLPPPELMRRVARTDDAGEFIRVGKLAAAQMMAPLAGAAVGDLLDWGCGCGRLAVHLLADYPDVRLCGCDPDEAAVGWCQQFLPGGTFTVSGLHPPLPYPGDSFDAVLACSVMTHLPRRLQGSFLRDIARVLRPGGVLVASVHGRAAAERFSELLGVRVATGGIADHYLDTALDGVLPGGYYRSVLQSPEFTRELWSQWLPVVGYAEAALNGFQDLVTCRKPE